MKRTLKSGAPLEDDEQIALVEWVDRWRSQVPELEMFAAVPNGGKRTHQVGKDGKRFSIEAARLKRMGVRAGYPDTLLDAPAGGFHGLRIELKSTDPKAVTSAEQRAWVARLRDRGYACHVCHGWVAAARAIADYLRPYYVPEVGANTPGSFAAAVRVDIWRRFSASVPRW